VRPASRAEQVEPSLERALHGAERIPWLPKRDCER